MDKEDPIPVGSLGIAEGFGLYDMHGNKRFKDLGFPSCRESGLKIDLQDKGAALIRTSNKRACWSLVFLVATACLLHAQEPSRQDIQESCRNFVQGFYDWYVKKDAVLDLALKYKREAFSPELFRLLKDDRDAQSKAQGEIVGLDFGPFLNTQDPGKQYLVGKVSRKGESFWVEVSGSDSEKPVVWPELVFKDGRWLFVNFQYKKDPQYPMNENLLSILKGLQADRSKHPK